MGRLLAEVTLVVKFRNMIRTKPFILGLSLALSAAAVWLGVSFGPGTRPEPEADYEDVGPIADAFRTGQDLDGDGRPEQILAGAEGLTVLSATGEPLLRFDLPVDPAVTVVRLEGDYPVLFAQTRPGEYAAFAYAPGRGLLQAVAWPNGQMRGYGRLQPDGSLQETVASQGARTRTSRLRLDQLQLHDSRSEYQPLTEPRQTPAETLAAALEAVALGLPEELGLHFAGREEAARFFRQWQGQIPPGAVRVAQADQVNAGAEHGHTVPIQVWIAGKSRVIGLAGDAAFVAGPKGVQIRTIQLAAIPLKVDTWEKAALAVEAHKAGIPRPQRGEAPFYGIFRFVAGPEHYAVDAVTGRVERE